MRLAIIASLVLGWAVLAPSMAQNEDVQFPRASTFGIALPDGFESARGTAGFHSPETDAYIMFDEFPPRFWRLRDRLLSLPAWGTTDFEVSDQRPRSIFGQDALEIAGIRNTTEHGQLAECKVLVQGSQRMGVITAYLPLPATASDACALIQTISERPVATLQQQIDALPFSFDLPPGYSLVDTFGGAGAAISRSATMDPARPAPVEILIVESIKPIGATEAERTPEDFLSFARKAALEEAGKHSIQEPSTRMAPDQDDASLFINAGHGGSPEQGGPEVSFLQYLIIYEDGHYIRASADAGSGLLAQEQENIETLFASLRRKSP